MSGVDLIVAAPAVGASAGPTNSATAAVQDAYQGLKTILRYRLGFTPRSLATPLI
jgi:hypothetical protein